MEGNTEILNICCTPGKLLSRGSSELKDKVTVHSSDDLTL
jgi:hypothetical protein